MTKMQAKFYEILAEDGVMVDEEKAEVIFNDHSIDIMAIDEEGRGLYGEKYYSAYDAVERLKFLGALVEEGIKWS